MNQSELGMLLNLLGSGVELKPIKRDKNSGVIDTTNKKSSSKSRTYKGWELIRDLSNKELKVGDKFKDNAGVDYVISKSNLGNLYLKNISTGKEVGNSLLALDNITFTKVSKDKEIDWTKVPKGTPVVAWDDFSPKINGYLCEVKSDLPYNFIVSELKEDDSFTKVTMLDHARGYKYCKIHESVDIPEEWYK